MPDRTFWNAANAEHTDIQRRGVSDISPVETVTVAGDTLAPAAPSSLTATSVPKGIKLEWSNPTTNADGTTCVDQRWVKIYWKSTTGVSKSSYDGNVVIAGRVGTNGSYTDINIASGTARYYVVTAIDQNGNESTESNEANSTGGSIVQDTDIPDDASGLIFDDSFGAGGEGIAVGDGMLGIVFKHPSNSWKNFDHYRLWYAVNTGTGFGAWNEIKPINRIGFIHKGLNTAYYYKYKATIVAVDGTESTTPDYATNNGNTGDGGTGYLPNATDNSLIMASTVLAENVVATNEVRGEHFYAQSYLAINDATFGNQGIQLDYNAGTPRAYIGNGVDNYFEFDGTNISWKGVNTELTAAGAFTATNATITGSITVTGGDVPYTYVSSGPPANADNTQTVIDGGLVTTGTIQLSDGTYIKAGMTAAGAGDTNVRIWAGDTYANRATAPFRVTQGGALYASSATISGAITTGSGSSIDGGFLVADSVTADKISVTNLSAINADLGAVTAGSIVVTDGTNTLWLNDASDGGLAVGGTVKTSAPFRVDSAGNLTATSATISGAITAGTGSSIDGSYLVDLSVGTAKIDDLAVTNAKIADATITSAKISSLVADKITGGTITAQTIILATDATPTQAVLKSSNYVAGSSGWQIDSDGNAEFNNVLARGTIETATSGHRVVISDDTTQARFRIYDANGTLTLSAQSWGGLLGQSFDNKTDLRDFKIYQCDLEETLWGSWVGWDYGKTWSTTSVGGTAANGTETTLISVYQGTIIGGLIRVQNESSSIDIQMSTDSGDTVTVKPLGGSEFNLIGMTVLPPYPGRPGETTYVRLINNSGSTITYGGTILSM